MNQTKYSNQTTVLTQKLALGDRCDSCGFQARIIAQTSLGEFWFCGHHWKQIEAPITRILLSMSEQSLEDASRPRTSRNN